MNAHPCPAQGVQLARGLESTGRERLLCGARAAVLHRDGDRTVCRLPDSDGTAIMTCYPVFPGIDLIYHDVHASFCRTERVEPERELLEIRHCREGRVEHRLGEDYFYLAPGDLAVTARSALPGDASFPTGHYHGISVLIDPARTPDCLSCFLEDVEVRPGALTEKFCRGGSCFTARSSPRVEHVFSELYCVPEDFRKGYFKVKILELLLFLSALPAEPERRAPVRMWSRAQVTLARRVSEFLLARTEQKVTATELAGHFGVSAAQLKSSFQGVYGMTPAAYLRLQKMHGAARLLRETDRTVLDIAGQFGYDNASKFARAFRDVIGVSPNAYRSGVEQDSCAPEMPDDGAAIHLHQSPTGA